MEIVSHKCCLPKKVRAVPTFSGAVSPKDSLVDSSWTFGKTSSLGAGCSPGQIAQASGGISILEGVEKAAQH